MLGMGMEQGVGYDLGKGGSFSFFFIHFFFKLTHPLLLSHTYSVKSNTC